MRKTMSRRDLIKGSVALGLSAVATPSSAAGPEPVSITPGLVEAARQEAKVVLRKYIQYKTMFYDFDIFLLTNGFH